MHEQVCPTLRAEDAHRRRRRSGVQRTEIEISDAAIAQVELAGLSGSKKKNEKSKHELCSQQCSAVIHTAEM